MIKEAYVSFETAKLLKEKGFDEQLDTVYSEYGNLHRIFDKEFYESTNFFITLSNSNYNDITRAKYKFFVTAPTLQMAMKWLGEVHDIFIGISLCERYENKMDNDTTIMFFFELLNLKEKQLINGFSQEYTHTYEDAVEAALKYCLENLI